jgi:cation diffusion facilitator CzcD-associated flavoprotein CzcO
MTGKHFDVVIVGAGLSGIGAAYHLQQKCPTKTYAILEGRASIGGTWDLFKYPGVRSDSDMYTLGYHFKPWIQKKAIADGPSILSYIQETADENDITRHIEFNTRVNKVSWSSQTQTWTLEVANTQHNNGDNGVSTITCNIISMCCGYYDYEQGFTPEFTGIDAFKGKVVHPQKWPTNLDYKDKKVVVIGSGATAMTLAPALSNDAEQVTMLQRSPTYVASRPSEDRIANLLNKVLPQKTAYSLVRLKNIFMQQFLYAMSRKDPDKLKKKIIKLATKHLPDDYVAKHFTPSYNPWDQRLCAIPDDDLFNAIKKNKLYVVTENIDTFTTDGIQLTSGQTLEADIVVTATGLNLLQLGGIEIVVDSKPISIANAYVYKGAMYSGIPNLFNTFGYINASWTLRSDLIAQYICKLINHMDSIKSTKMTPTLPETDRNMTKRYMFEEFSPNYMKRAMHTMPKQGDKTPWIMHQNYKQDKKSLNDDALEDGILIFTDATDAA